ncbi:MAG: penicillin-binding protein 1C [Cytophagales bacterium]|nr:penicillin-binding protein 1C [Cytophagales bacterium]MDW8384805.1 penicillin-binding protein 1C [Flammeovirgaceae bacterium]
MKNNKFAFGAKLYAWVVRSSYILALLLGLFMLLDALFPISVRIPYSTVVLSSEGEILAAYLSRDDKWRLHVTLDEIAPEFLQTILYKEDKYFYYHFGVNPISIGRAALKNILQMRITSGASTITMQVARLLEPKPRTFLSKLIEIFRAFQLEWHYSKQEILTFYVNLLPYGGNIEGIKAASWLYLGKSPKQLTWSEATLLAAIPNRPTSLAITKRAQWTQARNQLLQKLYFQKMLSFDEYETALQEPISFQRRSLPQHAPHLTQRLRQMYPHKAIIRSSISLSFQEKISTLVKKYINALSRYGIFNAAVLVVDNNTGYVVAYIGSPCFDDFQHAGQVDAVRTLRSPGSTLKPFIYGIAFERGICTPKTVLTDVPVDFDGYRPENFNMKFHGKVTVEQALTHSLNVVAVKVLDQIGVETFLNFLEKAGFYSIAKQHKRLGLSVALGGCGVTLEELTALYVALARQGEYISLKYLLEEVAERKTRLFSLETAFILTDILSQIERPDLPNNAEAAVEAPQIAWKTGTSYGRRDAWSIGYSKKYTVGVWLGNHDAKGIQELTGAGLATPLLFKVFRAIENNAQLFRIPPTHLKTRVVCTETGLPPAETCENLTPDWFIPGISPSQICSHQRYFFVDTNERYHFCSDCLPENGFQKKLYPNYSPELIAFFEKEKIPYLRVPPHYEKCQRFKSDGKGPLIVSPVDGREYFLTHQQVEVALKCQTANHINTVYWYVNDELSQIASPFQAVFVKLPKGNVKISCTDDLGRTSHIRVVVK